jgi:hypothetical protein
VVELSAWVKGARSAPRRDMRRVREEFSVAPAIAQRSASAPARGVAFRRGAEQHGPQAARLRRLPEAGRHPAGQDRISRRRHAPGARHAADRLGTGRGIRQAMGARVVGASDPHPGVPGAVAALRPSPVSPCGGPATASPASR